MKTLQNYIIESILDDEDDILTSIDNISSNPLLQLVSIYDETKDLRKREKDVQELLEIFLKDVKLDKYEYRLFDDHIQIHKKKKITYTWKDNIITPNELLVAIRFARESYIDKGAKLVIISFEPAKNLKKYSRAIEQMSKKYNLKKQPYNRHIIW